jgi:adenylate cyclase
VEQDPVREVDAEWLKVLTEGHRPQRLMQVIFKRIPSDPRCKVCRNPFGGVGGKVFARFGFRPSRKNPTLCEMCCEGLPPGGAEVDLAVLFADVRGSVALSERMAAGEYAALLNRFYTSAARVLIRHDALIDKLIGDEVMALFIPGVCGKDYPRRAVEAAIDLLDAVGWAAGRRPWLNVGVGLHAGVAYAGNVGGDGVVDFTAVGDTVNTAARLQGVAEPGEIALTEELYTRVAPHFPGLLARDVSLRGKAEPVRIRLIGRPAVAT